MKIIEHAELKEEYRGIPPFKIVFRKGLNLIVGDNGSGKSTLLSLLTGDKQDFFDRKKGKKEGGFHFFDTERMNPRLKGDLNGCSNIAYTLNSHFWSHGETMLPIITQCENWKDSAIIMDEPEAGISLKNQKRILAAFKTSVKNDCQVIVSTHSYVLIKSVSKVFNMDTKKWTSSKEFLNL